MKTNLLILAIFLAGILMSGCLKGEPLKLAYEGFTPASLDDNWEISTPTEEGFDREVLDEVYEIFYDEDQYPNIRSLLIARNGKLVAEAYCKDQDVAGMTHHIMSITKSITSLVVGIALDKGFIGSIDDPVYLYLPEYFDSDILKQSITVRQVLTMETGLEFDNDVHTNEMFNYKGSSLDYVLSKPMVFSPGQEWYYGDGNPQLLSGIIRKVTGKTMEEFAVDYLFNPLGISEYYWENHSDGLTLGDIGLWLLPRDMAKIGQLMLNEGSWMGHQVVSKEWVTASTMQQTTNREYGYYWYPVDEMFFYASGSGGQVIWVDPENQIVVVITADSYARSWILTKGSYDMIFQGIYDAILD